MSRISSYTLRPAFMQVDDRVVNVGDGVADALQSRADLRGPRDRLEVARHRRLRLERDDAVERLDVLCGDTHLLAAHSVEAGPHREDGPEEVAREQDPALRQPHRDGVVALRPRRRDDLEALAAELELEDVVDDDGRFDAGPGLGGPLGGGGLAHRTLAEE